MNCGLIELFIEEHGEELDRFIYNNLYHKQYFKDFKQEVMLKLCEMNNIKLTELFIQDSMLHYAKRIVLNMFNNKYQPYHKLIRQHIEDSEFNERNVDLYEYIEEDKEDKLLYIESLNNEPNFWIQLFKYYIVNDISLNKVSEDLKIPKTTLHTKFIDIKKKLRDDYVDK